MKKILVTLLLFTLVFAVGTASAKTATCLAHNIDPDNMSMQMVHVRFLAYNEADNTVTCELLMPERFDEEEIRELEVGDSIFTGGEEVIITAVDDDKYANYYILNYHGNDEDDYIYLCEIEEGVFVRYDFNDDYVWLSIATVELPVPDNLIFQDDEDWDLNMLPKVFDASVFIATVKGENGVPLDIYNAIATFGPNGELAVVRRYYVPWD